MSRKWLWVWMSLSLAACARSTSSQRAEVDDVRWTFKTSMQVLLAHRSDLALTDVQADRCEKLDFRVQEQNALLQHKLEELRTRLKEAKNKKPWHGGYMGGGSHDVHGGKGASTTAPDGVRDPDMVARRDRLEGLQNTMREMQDNDSRAYLELEKELSEEQRPRARLFVSEEREKQFKEFEAVFQELRKRDP